MGKEEINAFLGSGTVYMGNLTFEGAVRIDGKFTGEITSSGALIVGKDAYIEGNIQVGELFLAGNLSGTANVSKRTTIHKTGTLQGNLNTPLLSIEEGAFLDATLCMRTTDVANSLELQELPEK